MKRGWQERLSQYLQSHALNQSESRNKIIEVILSEDRHFNSGDLVKWVQARYPSIGAATVYRNLPLLVNAEILQETLTDDQGQKVYEIADDDHHDHIVCLDCDQIFEFHDEAIEKAQDRVIRAQDFNPVRHRHVIYAHCQLNHRENALSKG